MMKSYHFFMSLLILVQFSCASKTSDRYREGSNVGQKVNLTVQQEEELTTEAWKTMSKDYPAVQDEEIQDYINQIGQKIVKDNNLDTNPYDYQFVVVDSPMVNAFALPAGKVFVTLPILALAETEAELAGVIGHEIGHVVARHTAERMYVAKKEQGKTWLFGGLGAVLGGAAGFFLGKKFCDPNDSECKTKMTLYGIGGGATGGLLIQKYGFMQNSQEDELESDRIGFKYALKSGYDKDKIGDFYTKLLALEKEARAKQGGPKFLGRLADAMSTHPPSDIRVKQAKELKNKSSQYSSSIITTDDFQKIKQKALRLVKVQDQNP
jgi:predicted Zn-dependent protease